MSRRSASLQRLRSAVPVHSIGWQQSRALSRTPQYLAEPPSQDGQHRPGTKPSTAYRTTTSRPSSVAGDNTSQANRPNAPIYQATAAIDKLRARLAQKAPGRVPRTDSAQGRSPPNNRSGMQPRADQSRSGGPSQGRRPGGDRASRPRRARKPRENNYEADDEDGQRPRDELDDDENSEANQQKRIIDQSYFEEPDRPVVPHDPSPAADLASYEHPGMPTLSTGNAYGQSRMLSRILGSSSSDVQLPRREAFDTYEAALQTPIGRGGFVHLPEGQDPKELEGKTWAWKDKERRFTQQWQVSPVEGEQLKMLGEKYIAGRYELAGKPETDPTREIVRRAAAAVGRNGSYGIKDGRQFMDKIRELMPKPAKV